MLQSSKKCKSTQKGKRQAGMLIGKTERANEQVDLTLESGHKSSLRAWRVRGCEAPGEGLMVGVMDQISIKTPNPKCRLFFKIYQ
jgi:hypothetical protein